MISFLFFILLFQTKLIGTFKINSIHFGDYSINSCSFLTPSSQYTRINFGFGRSKNRYYFNNFPLADIAERNENIAQLIKTTVNCFSDNDMETIVDFVVEWQDINIKNRSIFEEAVINYFAYLNQGNDIKSENLKISKLIIKTFPETKIQIKIVLTCNNESFKNCVDAIGKVMENFSLYDLLIFYSEMNIETIIHNK